MNTEKKNIFLFSTYIKTHKIKHFFFLFEMMIFLKEVYLIVFNKLLKTREQNLKKVKKTIHIHFLFFE